MSARTTEHKEKNQWSSLIFCYVCGLLLTLLTIQSSFASNPALVNAYPGYANTYQATTWSQPSELARRAQTSQQPQQPPAAYVPVSTIHIPPAQSMQQLPTANQLFQEQRYAAPLPPMHTTQYQLAPVSSPHLIEPVEFHSPERAFSSPGHLDCFPHQYSSPSTCCTNSTSCGPC
ncbi:MAG: hypothetical protein R3C11_26455 [Planctomycetaceae bacterium]